MIQYSTAADLVTVINLINKMSEEDKINFNGVSNNFFVDMTYFHYSIIKGSCLMLKNDEKETIGFVAFNLNDDNLYISNLYIDDKKRKDSFQVLTEMFQQLKMYMRHIVFKVNNGNEKMHHIAKFIKAKATMLKDNTVTYVVHI
jgi:predicted transcriptional regulator YheO